MSQKSDSHADDPVSFKNILEGVKRMREEYAIEGENLNEETTHSLANLRSNYDRTNTVNTRVPADSRGTTGRMMLDNTPKLNTSNQRNIRYRQSSPGTNVRTYSTIQVSNSQKGNPLLTNSLMKTVPWSYDSSILSDYYINPCLQFLFLSLKYHKLHPEYIWQRLRKMNKGSTLVSTINDNVLRVLLVVVDVDSHQEILRRLLNLCIKHDLTLVLSWSFEEAGNYIAFAKQYESIASKVDSEIKGVKSSTYQGAVVDTLTSIRTVNKTDSVKLLANCGSVKNIVLRSCEPDTANDGISTIQGIGDRKLRNMKRVFLEPFILNKTYDK